MDADTTTRFITSLTKSLQAVIHGCLDFEKDIELGGYVYLRVDSSQRVDYVLNEKMQKGDTNSLTFHSNSFHAIPQSSAERNKVHKDRHDSALTPPGATESKSSDSGPGRLSSSTSKASHSDLDGSFSRTSDSFIQPQGVGSGGSDADFRGSSGNVRPSPSSNRNAPVNTSHGSRRDRSQSLTDFQTAFRNPSSSLAGHSQPSSMGNWSVAQNGSNPRLSSSQPLHHQQQQQQQQQHSKASVLPDAGDMEVVHIKTEEEDDMFNLALPCQQGGSESDGLAVQGKAPWLTMRMRQPFYFPYSRLARSQSWDRRMNIPTAGPRFPLYSGESGSETASLTCKECGKSYRSRQGLLFHERAKHQNVFNVYCPLCGKGFQQATHMHGHMATHTNVKNFQCQACGAKYAHKTSLQQHLRSGACRASHAAQAGAGGLDLSTSQMFRDFSSYNNLPELQPRPSPAHSQTQSPLEPDMLHSEGEAAMQQKQIPGFSPADIASPQHLEESLGAGEGLGDQGVGMDRTHAIDGSGGDMASEGYSGEPGDAETKGVNLMGRRQTGSTNSSGENRIQDMKSTGSDEDEHMELTGRDARGGLAVLSPDQAIGVDMSKNVQTYKLHSNAAPADDNMTTSYTDQHEDSVYEHEADVHETVSLSLSADDD